jgi:hypothetical protein
LQILAIVTNDVINVVRKRISIPLPIIHTILIIPTLLTPLDLGIFLGLLLVELNQHILHIEEGLHYVVFLLSFLTCLELGRLLHFVFSKNNSK